MGFNPNRPSRSRAETASPFFGRGTASVGRNRVMAIQMLDVVDRDAEQRGSERERHPVHATKGPEAGGRAGEHPGADGDRGEQKQARAPKQQPHQ